jgi:uncharacterized protein (TIGR02996 family)
MSDSDALLRGILENPDDDAPRLVYADWLEEEGKADHAELIRIQCERPHSVQRGARAAELEWAVGGSLAATPGVRLWWERGFIGRITTGLLNYLDHAGSLASYAPAVEVVLERDNRDDAEMEDLDFEEYDAVFARFADCPQLTSCIALDLSAYCPGIEGMGLILRSPYLSNLRRLNAPNNEAGPSVEEVARPTYARLAWANFHNSDSASDCPSVTPLVTSPHLANLEYLDFGSCEQGDDDLLALAATPHMARLRYLNVSVSWFTPAGIEALGRAGSLGALTELDLAHSFGSSFTERDQPGSGDAHLAALANSPLIGQLTHLSLAGNGISDAGAQALAQSARSLRLTHLDLTSNPIGEAGRSALCQRLGRAVRLGEED